MFSQNDIMFYDPDACEDDVNHSGDSNGSDVYMIGDSITVLSQNDIKTALPNITIDAVSGTWFSSDTDGESGVTRLSKMGDQKILVFAMGTNGGVTQDDIEKLLTALEGKDVKVILMTLYYQHDGSKTQMDNSNKVIKAAANKYENISIMDWYAVASADPENILADDSSASDGKDNVHPSSPTGTKKFAETVKNAVNEISTVNVEAAGGATGDFSAIMSAKNANESVDGNISTSSEWYAGWDDNDTESLKRVLEHYGDLAYQTGQVVNAPWQAIIVQMRYENPWSRCGSEPTPNNFWGIGCSGSLKRAKTENLGQGFIKYAETLTNGYHDQALNITDPKEYLEKLGPTWVQGECGGYCTINAMKKSIDVLQSFIDSPEGQAIVKQFGNYHSGGGTSTQCCIGGTSSPYAKTASTIKWEDGWIVPGTYEGYEKVPAVDHYSKLQSEFGSDYLTNKINGGDERGPNKILLHSTEGSSNGDAKKFLDLYSTSTDGEGIPAHFTIDIKNKLIAQHGSINKASAAIMSDDDGNGDLTAGIQIEIIGFGDNSHGAELDLSNAEQYTDEDWKYLVDLLSAISAETGIPLTSSVNWADSESVRITDAEKFKNYEGILSHKHAYYNDHTDITEAMWNRIETAISKYGGQSNDICGLGSGDVAALKAYVLKFAWPEYRGGFTEQMPDYREAVKKPYYHGGCGGNDCGGFVTTLMRESGWDPNYNSAGCNTTCQSMYLMSPANGWVDMTNFINSNDDAQPGDVLMSSSHTLVYVGDIPGFNSKMASASYSSACTAASGNRSPMADSVEDISYYIHGGYRVYRKTK